MLFTRQGMVISLTVAGILALVAVYLFKYVPDNEQKLKARRFRALERTQVNLESKIKNSFQFLETQLDCYTDSTNSDKKELDDYLKSLNKDDRAFTLGKVYKPKLIPSTNQSIVFDDDSVCCTYVLPSPKERLALQIKYNSENFIRSLLPKNLFDEFLLIKDSCLLFATFPTGNQKIRPDSILHFITSLPVSSEGEVHFGGQHYRIFLQPLSIDNKSQWILGGLLQEKRFISERSQLDPKKVLSLITISIILLILLPWIKLFFMGNRDRLTHVDGFLSFVVAMLMMCMVFFVFARNLPIPAYHQSLQVLADRIDSTFDKELRTAKDLLNVFDNALAGDSTLRHDFIYLGDTAKLSIAPGFKIKSQTHSLDRKTGIFLNRISKPIKDIDFNYVYWLDTSGQELYNWSAQSTVRPHQNFKTRKYFKGHQNRNRSDTIVDQVVSWTTGEFRTVISKASKIAKDHVVAISVKMRSMEDHILPEGYTAMIINWRGEVLYHTDKTHNLNEYLPEEFEDSSLLKSALYSRSPEEFNVEYQGSRYHVMFKPLEQSYFLLVLRNQSFENTRDVNAFGFALGMYGFFFLVILLQYICMVSLFSARVGLNSKLRLVDTLFPSKQLQPAYRCAAVGNLFMITMFACFNDTSLVAHIYMLLSAVAINAIFINLVCAWQHHIHNGYRLEASKKKNAIVVSVFLILYNIGAGGALVEDEFSRYFLFENLIIIGLVLLYARFRYRGKLFEKYAGHNTTFIRSYAWMAVTRIIITSGIPVLFFYVDAYNYEQGLQNRHAQKQFAFRYARSLQSSKAKSAIFIDSNTISENKFTEGSIKFMQPSSDTGQSHKLLNKLRLLDDTISISNNNLYHATVVKDAGVFYQNDLYAREIPSKGGFVVIKSKPNQLHIFQGQQDMQSLKWLLLLIGLIVFYHIIKLIMDKVFAIYFTAHSTLPDIEPANDLEQLAGITSAKPLMERKLLSKTGCMNPTRQFNFIIATAGSGITEAIGQLRQDDEFSKKICVLDLHVAFHTIEGADMTHLEAASQGDYQCILIDHFEWLLHNYHLHLPVMKLFEKKIHDGSASISLLSELHPTDFYDHLYESAEALKITDAKKAEELTTHAHRWEHLLAPFHIAFMGMARLSRQQQEASGLLQFLEQELQWGDFLNQCFNHYKNELISTTASKPGSASTETVPVTNS